MSLKTECQIDISIVVSVFNEEEGIEIFYKELNKVLISLNLCYEIIFINDGSTDGTADILTKIVNQNKRIKLINFSRNFGHEAAMIAGLDHSSGKLTICMDADLQNPPDALPEMISTYEKGFDIILMKRIHREDAGFFSKFMSKCFYKIINLISPVKFEANSSDFFLINAKVRKVLVNSFRERTRFLRGYIQIIGFRKTYLEYTAPSRIAGKSKYSVRKLFKLSVNAIASFSEKPLDLGIFAGLIMGIISMVVGIYSIVMYFIDKPVSGYTTIVVLISFLFSINFLIMGIIGKYLAFLFSETKGRPIYIVDEIMESSISNETE
ncbi:MAG: glycosyltransferase family 2 protein [Bacteroidota bacterium]